MASRTARPNLEASTIAMRDALSKLLTAGNNDERFAHNDESPAQYIHRVLEMFGAPCVSSRRVESGETVTIQMTRVKARGGSPQSVLAFALFDLCGEMTLWKQWAEIKREALAWRQVFDATETALRTSEALLEKRKPLLQENEHRGQIIEQMTKVRDYLAGTFSEEDRPSEAEIERTVVGREKALVRHFRIELSPEFSDLEIGRLIDDGLGGDARAKADRVRRERERAEKCVDQGSSDGPQRSSPGFVILRTG